MIGWISDDAPVCSSLQHSWAHGNKYFSCSKLNQIKWKSANTSKGCFTSDTSGWTSTVCFSLMTSEQPPSWAPDHVFWRLWCPFCKSSTCNFLLLGLTFSISHTSSPSSITLKVSKYGGVFIRDPTERQEGSGYHHHLQDVSLLAKSSLSSGGKSPVGRSSRAEMARPYPSAVPALPALGV